MDFFILAALIVLNGCFAMSEIALVTAKRNRLQKLADAGDRAAKTAIKLGSEPTRFLSTVQIGITAIGVLNGIAGESAFAKPLALHLIAKGLEKELSEALATALVVIIITYLTIVLGELVPKRIGQSNAERIARVIAQPIALLALISRPFVSLLSLSTEAMLRLLKIKENNTADLTEDDLFAVLSEGSESGIIEKHEHDMVRKVLRMEDRPVASLMTPRNDLVWLDSNKSLADNLVIVHTSPHSCFPVCDGELQNVLGVVSAKHLLRLTPENGDLHSVVQPAVFVPDTITGMEMLEQFRASSERFVLVVDEYGSVLGLVTQQDVLEALTGEFKAQDTPSDEGWAFQRDDGSWLLDGLIPIDELKDRLGLSRVPDEDKAHYQTLSGMMMALLGNVPHTGARAEWEDWRLEVVDMDGNRADKILATRWQAEDDSG